MPANRRDLQALTLVGPTKGETFTRPQKPQVAPHLDNQQKMKIRIMEGFLFDWGINWSPNQEEWC